MKKVLITGKNSYIGISVERWLLNSKEKYEVTTISLRNNQWKDFDFHGYDSIFHVAGLAHSDVRKLSEEQKLSYYEVNTKLTIEVAHKAKQSGVRQFIFMSSMIVYSGCPEKIITINSIPTPLNFYGDSKLQAEKKLQEIEDFNFRVAILRPPLIYGRNCKGNYSTLAKFATKLPFFPNIKNQRSMLYIDNLCQFVKLVIDNQDFGLFFPQNRDYSVTSHIVCKIAQTKNHRIILVPGFGWLIKLMMFIPGETGVLVRKAFGDFVYDMSLSTYKNEYRVIDLDKSIELTEL